MSMPIPPFSSEIGPVPNITPFTYRDGRTYLDKLAAMVYWANNSLVPQMNEAVEIVINDGIQLQDPVMAGIINNTNSQGYLATRNFVSDFSETVNVNKYGIKNDGSAIQNDLSALIANAPDNTLFTFEDGIYNFAAPVATNKNVTIKAGDGARFIRSAIVPGEDEEIIIAEGSYGTVNLVSLATFTEATTADRGFTTLNLNATAIDLAPGDRVKLIADDPVPASRTNTARAGWRSVVLTVSGTVVTLAGTPRDPMTTNLRVARINKTTVEIDGGSWAKASEFITPAKGGSLITLRTITDGTVNIGIDRSAGAGVHFVDCDGYNFDIQARVLRDSWDDGQGANPSSWGYGVLDTNSERGRGNLKAYGVRHGFSTGQGAPAVGQGISTDLAGFGLTEYASISGEVMGAYSSGFDTHEASYGVHFHDFVSANAGYAGIGLRGRGHMVSDGEIYKPAQGIRAFDDNNGGESYGHTYDHVTIIDPAADALTGVVHPTGHPSAGVRQGPGIFAFEATDITIRGLKGHAVSLLNARAKADIKAAWGSAVSGVRRALVNANNSEFNGMVSELDARLVTGTNRPSVTNFNGPIGDTSVIDINSVRVRGTTDQVNAITSVENMNADNTTVKAILPDVRLDNTIFSTSWQYVTIDSIVDFATVSGASDSARVAVTQASPLTSFRPLAFSRKSVLAVDYNLTAPGVLPGLYDGKLNGQRICIRNRSSSTQSLTINHGGNIINDGAVNKTVAPGKAIEYRWDSGQNAWCQLAFI